MIVRLILLTLLIGFIGLGAVAYAQDGIRTTSKGTLDIQIEPIWIDGTSKVIFKVNFLSPGTNTLHEHQDYDFKILKDCTEIFSAARQTGQVFLHNAEGTITVPYTFKEPGDYTIQVILAGTGIAPTIPTDEDAKFRMNLYPAFPDCEKEGNGGGIVKMGYLQECEFLVIHDSECNDTSIISGRKALAASENSTSNAILLSTMSYGGKYIIDAYWKPNDIGQKNDFDIFFYNSTENGDPIVASYTISIMKDGIPIESARANQISTRQSFVFDEADSYALKIENINGIGESIQIPIQVSPEFQIVSVAVLGLSVAVIIAIFRFKFILSSKY